MYPALVHATITNRALQYRRRLQARFLSFLPRLGPPSCWRQVLVSRFKGKSDLFLPTFQIDGNVSAVDTLCALVEISEKRIAILHSRQTVKGPEGLGRTALLLKLLGISFKYGQIPNDPTKVTRVPFDEYGTVYPGTKLLTSDFTYISNLEGKLIVLPVLAEPLLGLWDLSRHIYRMIERDYEPGLRLTPRGRKMLGALMRNIPSELVLKYYGPWQHSYTIDIAVILQIDRATSPRISVSLVKSNQARIALNRAFNSVLYLRTPFWDKKRIVHRRLVKAILESAIILPRVYIISIPRNIIYLLDKNEYSDALIQEFTYILKGNC